MNEYALIKNGEFVEVRRYTEKPDDIPHKGIIWLPVAHETTDTSTDPILRTVRTENVVEANRYLIRTVVSDLPASQAVTDMSVTPFQARVALLQAGLLPQIETLMADPQVDPAAKIAWEYALSFDRKSPFISSLAASLNLSENDVDLLFIAAKKVEV